MGSKFPPLSSVYANSQLSEYIPFPRNHSWSSFAFRRTKVSLCPKLQIYDQSSTNLKLNFFVPRNFVEKRREKKRYLDLNIFEVKWAQLLLWESQSQFLSVPNSTNNSLGNATRSSRLCSRAFSFFCQHIIDYLEIDWSRQINSQSYEDA